MNESSLKREQPAQDLPQLSEPSSQDKGQETSNKGDKGGHCYFPQISNFVLEMSLPQDILFENDCKEGQSGIEIDMFEVEQDSIAKGCLQVLLPPHQFDTAQEDGLHDDVVLKVDI